jgi:pyruvate/2-oxoglutarate dehydrogenase complex dihydrolipoamide dehydrogenase (E3) component
MESTDVAVIGGGPAGLAAAAEAAQQGLGVVLIEAERLGARATHRTQLPARVLGYEARRRPTRAPSEGPIDPSTWQELQQRVAAVSARWAERERLRMEDRGVSVRRGAARFTSPTTLAVGDAELAFDRCIVASGARARSLPGLEVDGARILHPDHLVGLEALPGSVLVIGGDTAGAEIADTLNRLGCTVAWIMDAYGILPSFDREIGEAYGDVLMERGVKLVHGKAAQHLDLDDKGRPRVTLEGGQTYWGDAIVLALGSEPRVEELAPSEAGLRVRGNGALETDARCGTSVPHVFAAGECTGWVLDRASSESMGRRAGRRAADLEVDALVPGRFVRAAYVEPEIAQVGLTPEQAAGQAVMIRGLGYDESQIGLLEGVGESDHAKGFVRIVLDHDGTVRGGTAVGPRAAELMGQLALAMHVGATEEALADFFPPQPSLLDILSKGFR